MTIRVEPIAWVRSPRSDLRDDDWGGVLAEIELAPSLAEESLLGLEAFSHVEVIFHFDRVPESSIERNARHPRGNTAWPRVGIFAQRGKNRPNRIGSTIVPIVGRSGRRLRVASLDAVDGTPVLDLKPVFREFLPRGSVRQPGWSCELMRDYWNGDGEELFPGAIHHLDVTVGDLARSIGFYDGVLSWLGFRRLPDQDGNPLWRGASVEIGLVASRPGSSRAHDRYSPGLHHLAFAAPDRASVDGFHRRLVEAGLPVLDPPASYEAYGPGYYAVFFPDPDGIKLEVVHTPSGAVKPPG